MLPIVIMLTLFAAAGVIFVIKVNVIAKRLAIAAHVLALALSALMLAVTADEPISVILGTEPWNFYVLVTPLDAFMVSLFIGVSLFILWASVTMIDHDIEQARIPMYYALMCVLIATLCGVVVFENFFNVFLLVEASSFAAAGTVVIKNKPENMRAGLKYISLSILGSSFILMGIIILYFITDSLSITGIYASLSTNFTDNEDSVRNALIFITLGTALKSALFPLHIWLPDAHGTAPSPSSAALSALVLKAYIFLYVKILYKAIGAEILLNDEIMLLTLFLVMVTGAVAMIAGSIFALMQSDIKRMIAYSSVAQIGYIFMGIGMGTRLGLFAAIFHILTHAVTKALLFLAAGSIIEQTHNRTISKMGGLGSQMRITMLLFTVGSLSMIGIPLFIGFNSKWFYAVGIIDSHNYWLLGVLALSSLLNAAYYLPIVLRAFFGKSDTEDFLPRQSLECPMRALMPIICLAFLIVALALLGGPVNSYIYMGIDSIW
ncbi:MAG: hypothetical protein FWE20_10240 [Defluviitaleaceae bacterium]|nr:hypothetical protein [Defluviitaleaceae bacterium]